MTYNAGEEELVNQKVMKKEEVNDKVTIIVHFKNIVRKKHQLFITWGLFEEENMVNID